MQILIVERRDLVREGLKVVLQRLDTDVVVRTCASFADALEAAKATAADLVFLDQDLPAIDGAAGAELFRSYFPEPRLVIVAERIARQDVLAAMRHGAVGYVLKSIKAEALLSAVRLILSGERYVPAEVVSADVLAPAGGDSGYDDARNAFKILTGREADVLEQLLGGLTNKEIGRALDVQEITVKLHLRSIYRKLDVRNRAQAVGRALSAGWRRDEHLH